VKKLQEKLKKNIGTISPVKKETFSYRSLRELFSYLLPVSSSFLSFPSKSSNSSLPFSNLYTLKLSGKSIEAVSSKTESVTSFVESSRDVVEEEIRKGGSIRKHKIKTD
jgi:hypothetical protein